MSRPEPSAYERAIIASVTERVWQQQVLDLAANTGWKTAHFRAALTKDGSWITPVAGDGKGFPDTVLAKDGRRLIVAELKRETTKPDPDQVGWLDVLSLIPEIDVCVWRPRDRHAVLAYLTDGALSCPGRWRMK